MTRRRSRNQRSISETTKDRKRESRETRIQSHAIEKKALEALIRESKDNANLERKLKERKRWGQLHPGARRR